jgi:hypothetical protein
VKEATSLPANMAGACDRVAMKGKFCGLQFKELRGTVKGRRRFKAALGLAAAIVAAGYFLWIHLQSANPQSRARMDQPLPSLVVASANATVDLRAFAAGARRVIVFYSPSCHICKEVLPALQPFPSNLRLIMVTESSDPNGPDISGLPVTALFQDRWHVLSNAFTGVALPTFLFVDGSGVLRDGLVGRHDRIFIQQKLKEFAIK